jgi:hypothetical protein
MTEPVNRSEIRHRLIRARMSVIAAQPFATVPVQREVLVDMLTLLEDLAREPT